jgi:DNA modification methylase
MSTRRCSSLDAQALLEGVLRQLLKPIELMRWLVRLVSPPGGLVLDPFCGSGSTGAAAALEGRRFLGIELSPEYVEIASARITHWAPGEGKVDRGPFGDRP